MASRPSHSATGSADNQEGPLPYLLPAPGVQPCVVTSEEQGPCFWQDLLSLTDNQVPEPTATMGGASYDDTPYLKTAFMASENDCFHTTPLGLSHAYLNHAPSAKPNSATFGPSDPPSRVNALPDTFCPEAQVFGHGIPPHRTLQPVPPPPRCYSSNQLFAFTPQHPERSLSLAPRDVPLRCPPEVNVPFVGPTSGFWEFGHGSQACGVTTDGPDRVHGTLEPEQGAAFPGAQGHGASTSTSGDPRFSSPCLPGVFHSAGPWGDLTSGLRGGNDPMATAVTATTAAVASSSPRLNKDELKVRSMKIPLSVSDIVGLTATDLAKRRSQLALSEAQMSLVRDIRRRGKNKAAAHNCRQRRLQGLVGLEGELGRLGAQREQLLCERRELEAALRTTRMQLQQLHGCVAAGPHGPARGYLAGGGALVPGSSSNHAQPHFPHAT